MSALNLKTVLFAEEPCIELKGACDQRSLDVLIKAFQKAVPKAKESLYLRLTELEYLDSSALGVIMFNYHELKNKSAKLIVLEPSDEMRELFHSTSLDKIIIIQ